MDGGERGAHRRAVRLRVGAQRLSADYEGERGGGQCRAAAHRAAGGEGEAVGGEQQEPALAGAVGLDEAEVADPGEPDELSRGGQRPGDRGRRRPAARCGFRPAGQGAGQCGGGECAEVNGERAEEGRTQQGGRSGARYAQFTGAVGGGGGAQQGGCHGQEAGSHRAEYGGRRPAAGGCGHAGGEHRPPLPDRQPHKQACGVHDTIEHSPGRTHYGRLERFCTPFRRERRVRFTDCHLTDSHPGPGASADSALRGEAT